MARRRLRRSSCSRLASCHVTGLGWSPQPVVPSTPHPTPQMLNPKRWKQQVMCNHQAAGLGWRVRNLFVSISPRGRAFHLGETASEAIELSEARRQLGTDGELRVHELGKYQRGHVMHEHVMCCGRGVEERQQVTSPSKEGERERGRYTNGRAVRKGVPPSRDSV